jgi:hypothetical protein
MGGIPEPDQLGNAILPAHHLAHETFIDPASLTRASTTRSTP